jgi:hypothetical protein
MRNDICNLSRRYSSTHQHNQTWRGDSFRLFKKGRFKLSVVWYSIQFYEINFEHHTPHQPLRKLWNYPNKLELTPKKHEHFRSPPNMPFLLRACTRRRYVSRIVKVRNVKFMKRELSPTTNQTCAGFCTSTVGCDVWFVSSPILSWWRWWID